MVGIAEMLLNQGFTVTGSDLVENKNTERLKHLGAKIFIGHTEKNVRDSDVVVYSTAVTQSNPEMRSARSLNKTIIARAEMLSSLMRGFQSIAVAGSHGKTTTTSLVASIFTAGNLDPTIINGGVLNSFGNSAKLGKSNWCVTESDESDCSFLKIPFTYSIATNLDSEHLDFYKNMNNLKKSFNLHIP